MAKYKSVNIDERLHKEIQSLVDDDKNLYRTTSEFVNSTLRDKLQDFRMIRLKERELELMEKQ